MVNKKGLTLVEVIIAIALLGIIAVAVIPGFTSQIVVMNQGKGLTQTAFEAQTDVEASIFEVRDRLQKRISVASLPGLRLENRTLFGQTVNLFRLEQPFAAGNGKVIFVYLSRLLAEVEEQNLLTASGVRIEVLNDSPDNDMVADMKRSPAPTLTGQWTPDTSTTFYANINKWYVSAEGISNPQFPQEYTQIELPGTDPPTLDDLLTRAGANRYIMFSITPVDINGVRGNEVASSNRVMVMGTEWRSGIFAWIDKNNNGNNEISTDVSIRSEKYKSTTGFDSSLLYPDPANPVVNLNPSSGAFYVPMRISPLAGPMTITGTEVVNWHIDRSIHLAKGINASNNSDITMKTREGNITLYQDIKLNPSGNAMYDSDGLVQMENTGPVLTTGGDIVLATEGSGMVGLNDFSCLDGDNIGLVANGQLYGNRTALWADGNISIDTSRNAGIPGSRDISFNNSEIRLNSSAVADRSISMKSRSGIDITNSQIIGNTALGSNLILNSKTGTLLDETRLTNIHAQLNDNTTITGGSWSTGYVVTVPDGKTITFRRGAAKILNNGSLNVGKTGTIDFGTGMAIDLQYPLGINLTQGPGAGQVMIATNYGRNIGYGDPMSPVAVASPGTYRDLGTGNTNLSFTADKTVATIPNLDSLTYDFDGERFITVAAHATGAVSQDVKLYVKDKFAGDEIIGAVNIHIQAGPGGGAAVVTVTTPVAPVLVTGIAVQSAATWIYKNEELLMTADVLPSNATNKSVSWSLVSGSNYGTIDPSTGWLLGVNPGTVRVMATATDGSGCHGERDILIKQPIIALPQVTNVLLSDKGIATWPAVANAVGYRVQLYKDNAVQGAYTDVNSAVLSKDYLSAMRTAGVGSYTVKVIARGDGTIYSNGPASAASNGRVIAALSQVTDGLTWDIYQEWWDDYWDARWTGVTGASTYSLQPYRNGIAIGSPVSDSSSPHDFYDALNGYGSGSYQYTVQPKAAADSLYIDGAVSPMSDIHSIRNVLRQWRFNSSTENWNPANQINNFMRYNDNGITTITGQITGNDPFIVSENWLGVDIREATSIEIVMKNSTSGIMGQIYFTTNSNTDWNETKHKDFGITANSDYTTYTVDMKDVSGWSGTLKQLRIDPNVNAGSGTFYIDSITILR